jgi:nucleotide-binding universal stress UspA family protein
MKDVLLGIDKSEQRAIELAENVAALFDEETLRAHLLHDFVDNPEGASVMQVAAIRRAEEILDEHGVEVKLHEGSGHPADSIIDKADELDVDAVCVAGRKRSPTGKLLFGSVSQEVILGTDRPVFICSVSEDGG